MLLGIYRPLARSTATAWLYELVMAANAMPQKLSAFFKLSYDDKEFDSQEEVQVFKES